MAASTRFAATATAVWKLAKASGPSVNDVLGAFASFDLSAEDNRSAAMLSGLCTGLQSVCCVNAVAKRLCAVENFAGNQPQSLFDNFWMAFAQ